MSKRTNLMSCAAILLMTLSASVSARTIASPAQPLLLSVTISDTDRDRDGLIGPVRRIRTETAKLVNKVGKPTEGQRLVLETAAYDVKGNKIENAYFPVAGGATLTGREVYKYDDKGNISEMTLFNADGSLLTRETYSYEYDFVGNWTKMTTSVAIIEGGKLGLEPIEVTYRTISYYLDDSLAKMVQPATSTGATAPASVPVMIPVSASTTKPLTNNTPTRTKTDSQKSATAIPPSVDVAALSKSAISGPTTSAGVPAATPANSKTDVANESEPPPPTVKPLMKPISGGVLNGKAISLPAPQYPEMARRIRATGLVAVEVVIDANGKVIAAKATSGPSSLQQAAVQAAYKARFSPTTLSGQPVKVTGLINYNFTYGN